MYYVHQFLSGRDLAHSSCVCREFYFSSFLASARHFQDHFGKPPPTHPRWRLTRLRLFTMVDRVNVHTDSNHRDLMIWSACRGYPRMIRTLASRTSVRVIDTRQSQTGATPLILAAEHGRAAAVELLLELGADVFRPASNGLCGVHVACKNGHLDIVRQLLDADAGLMDHTTTSGGRSPLMFAASAGHMAIVRLLVERGANLDAATDFDDADADVGGDTALHLAAFHGRSDIVDVLLKNGANPDMSMRNGRTPLIIGCEQGHSDVVRLLLQRRCFVHAVTNSGKTALYSACENGHTDIVPMLLDYGCDVNQVRVCVCVCVCLSVALAHACACVGVFVCVCLEG